MKKLISFSVFSVVSFINLYPHTVHADGLLQGLTETIKSAAEIAKEAQSLKGPKKSDTSSSSWGGSSWGSTGTSAWDWGTGTTATVPATTPSTGAATDPFADLGTLSSPAAAPSAPVATSGSEDLNKLQQMANSCGATVVMDTLGNPTDIKWPDNGVCKAQGNVKTMQDLLNKLKK